MPRHLSILCKRCVHGDVCLEGGQAYDPDPDHDPRDDDDRDPDPDWLAGYRFGEA